MADTPVDIHGNATEITISLPLEEGKPQRKLIAKPEKKTLRVIVKTEQKTTPLPLGENWQIIIE